MASQGLDQAAGSISLEATGSVDEMDGATDAGQRTSLLALFTDQRQQAFGQHHRPHARLGQLDQRQIGVKLHARRQPQLCQGGYQIAVDRVLQIHGEQAGRCPSFLLLTDQIEGFIPQQRGVQTVSGGQTPGTDAEQGLTGSHPGQDHRRVVGGNLQVGVLAQIAGHEGGQVAGQQGFGAGDGQGVGIGEGLAVGQQPLHLGQGGAETGQQLVGLGSEPDLAAIGFDQLLAEPLFQLIDAFADRRLADIEATGNLAHGAFARQQKQGIQPFQ